MMTTATRSDPFTTYVALLLRLHQLYLEGKDDGPEGEAVRARMDAPWYAMTEEERELVGGLSEDLYSLAEGAVPQTGMTPEERLRYGREAAEIARPSLSGGPGRAELARALVFLR